MRLKSYVFMIEIPSSIFKCFNSQKTSENRSERSSLLAVGPGGDASSAAAAFVNQLKGSTEVQKFTPESFVSLQLEKVCYEKC